MTGAVQGVGFRPFVYRLATELGLSGWVLNDVRGVEVEVEGADALLDAFRTRLEAEAPPRAVGEERLRLVARAGGVHVVRDSPEHG